MAIARPNFPADEPAEQIEAIDDLRRIAADVQQENRPRLVSIAGGATMRLAPASKKRR